MIFWDPKDRSTGPFSFGLCWCRLLPVRWLPHGYAKAIALRFNIVDKPDNLVKTHKKPVAYLGGIGVLVGFFVGILCGVYLVRGQNRPAG